MDPQTAEALQTFTHRYCDAWQQQSGTLPRSEALYGVPSPCLESTGDEVIFWKPQPFVPALTLEAIEKALNIVVQPAIHAFYTTQFAGDMPATFMGRELTLLQVWSPEDFQRVQENQIGHLVTQQRLKLSPTLFIGTLDSDLDVVSVCNLSGEVVVETLGTRQRTTLAPSLEAFLAQLIPSL